MIKKIIIILLLINTVNALHDSYIFLENRNIPVCISADGLDNPICNNESLRLEGTDDHEIIFQPEIVITPENTTLEKLSYLVLTPFNLIISLSLLLGGIIIASTLAYFVASMAGLNNRKF